MKRPLLLLIIFIVLVGGIAATVAAVADTPPENLVCAKKRVAVFGWTSRRQSLAELAAIAKWQSTVKTELPGFEQWHQAFKRNLSCRLFEDSGHYQCEISATPCHYKKDLNKKV